MSEANLLREYVRDNSEDAFHALVERHSPLVYSAALRQTGNSDLAEDLTRVVFILLARKSGQLSPKTILADWLFRTTRQTVAKKLRNNRCREPKFFDLPNCQGADVWDRVVPFLDEALANLGKAQRSAVLLHYLQNKRLGEVGLTLGHGEGDKFKGIR